MLPVSWFRSTCWLTNGALMKRRRYESCYDAEDDALHFLGYAFHKGLAVGDEEMWRLPWEQYGLE